MLIGWIRKRKKSPVFKKYSPITEKQCLSIQNFVLSFLHFYSLVIWALFRKSPGSRFKNYFYIEIVPTAIANCEVVLSDSWLIFRGILAVKQFQFKVSLCSQSVVFEQCEGQWCSVIKFLYLYLGFLCSHRVFIKSSGHLRYFKIHWCHYGEKEKERKKVAQMCVAHPMNKQGLFFSFSTALHLT